MPLHPNSQKVTTFSESIPKIMIFWDLCKQHHIYPQISKGWNHSPNPFNKSFFLVSKAVRSSLNNQR